MTLKSSTRDISKQPGKLTKGVLFHQDNAPAHKFAIAIAIAMTVALIRLIFFEDFFEDQDERFYTTGIQVLQHRWKKSNV